MFLQLALRLVYPNGIHATLAIIKKSLKATGILLAGGESVRFGGQKLAENMGGATALGRAFLSLAPHVSEVIVVGPKQVEAWLPLGAAFRRVNGGENRFQSALRGAEAAKKSAEILVFLNGASPAATPKEFETSIALAQKTGASAPHREIFGTVRRDEDIIPRAGLFEAETPQSVQPQAFFRGAALAAEQGCAPTDDVEVARMGGASISFFPASATNRKITTPADAAMLLQLLRGAGQTCVGTGFDAHQFGTQGQLRLGGVDVPGAPALLGESDGDALMHALADAVCTAMGWGSFSAVADPMCRAGVRDSAQFLAAVCARAVAAGGTLGHLSAAIEAGKPRLEQHLPAMRVAIAAAAGIAPESVGLSVGTGDGLSEVSRGRGVAVRASAALAR